MKSRYPVAICFICMIVIVGCDATPDMAHRGSARDVQFIPAKRSDVSACIALQLKALRYFKVIESVESVQLKKGDLTTRVYVLEESVGGTTVTLYSSSRKNAKDVISRCREYLGSPKPLPQRPAN